MSKNDNGTFSISPDARLQGLCIVTEQLLPIPNIPHRIKDEATKLILLDDFRYHKKLLFLNTNSTFSKSYSTFTCSKAYRQKILGQLQSCFSDIIEIKEAMNPLFPKVSLQELISSCTETLEYTSTVGSTQHPNIEKPLTEALDAIAIPLTTTPETVSVIRTMDVASDSVVVRTQPVIPENSVSNANGTSLPIAPSPPVGIPICDEPASAVLRTSRIFIPETPRNVAVKVPMPSEIPLRYPHCVFLKTKAKQLKLPSPGLRCTLARFSPTKPDILLSE